MSLLSQQRMGVAAILLSISSLLSRLMGLIRDKVISWQFGAGQEADMYFAAFVVPDMINYLLAGGFMSITIIPLLARLFQENEEDGWRFFSSVTLWTVLLAALATLGCMVSAETLASIVAPGFTEAQQHRLAFFMRIILPAQLFFLTGACCTAVLFLRHQFRVPALSPLIYNGAIILGGVLFPAAACLFFPGSDYQSMLDRFGMTGYCIGVSTGAFIGAFLLPFLAVRRGGLRLVCAFWHPSLRTFFVIALPLMIGQTIIMLDEQFLRIFGSYLGSGTVSLLNYARRIAQVPIGLVGQACAVASYPFLVQLLAQGRTEEFLQTLRSAFRNGLLLILPCVVWMIVAAEPVLTLIFQGGRFGQAETVVCAPLLQIMLLGVPLLMLYMILVRAFYAHEDTLTPAVTGTVMTVLVLPVYALVSSRISAGAIALTSVISVSSYILWLMVIFRRRYGTTAFHGLGTLSLRSLLCTVPAGAAALAVHTYLPGAFSACLSACSSEDVSHPLLQAFCELSVSGIVYLLVLAPCVRRFLPELTTLLRPYLGRILRRGGQDQARL